MGRERETGDFCWSMQDCKELACRGQCLQELILPLFSSRDEVSSTPPPPHPLPKTFRTDFASRKGATKIFFLIFCVPEPCWSGWPVAAMVIRSSGWPVVAVIIRSSAWPVVAMIIRSARRVMLIRSSAWSVAGYVGQIVSLVCSGPCWSACQLAWSFVGHVGQIVCLICSGLCWSACELGL